MIEEWLNSFKDAWMSKDIDAVIDLFSDDVKYWETPFVQLISKEIIKSEWKAIHQQNKMVLEFDVFSSVGHKNGVKWHLKYEKDGSEHEWGGVYIIELNEQGKCTYFYQVGEKRV